MLIFCLIQLLFITVLCAVKIIYPNKQLNIINKEENSIIKYRQKHKRCRYCVYKEVKERTSYGDFWNYHYTPYREEYFTCKVKNKEIFPWKKIRGCFCPAFKPENIQIKKDNYTNFQLFSNNF